MEEIGLLNQMFFGSSRNIYSGIMLVVYLPSACTCKSLILVDVMAPTLNRSFLMVVESICCSSKLCYAHPAIWTRTVAWSTALVGKVL